MQSSLSLNRMGNKTRSTGVFLLSFMILLVILRLNDFIITHHTTTTINLADDIYDKASDQYFFTYHPGFIYLIHFFKNIFNISARLCVEILSSLSFGFFILLLWRSSKEANLQNLIFSLASFTIAPFLLIQYIQLEENFIYYPAFLAFISMDKIDARSEVKGIAMGALFLFLLLLHNYNIFLIAVFPIYFLLSLYSKDRMKEALVAGISSSGLFLILKNFLPSFSNIYQLAVFKITNMQPSSITQSSAGDNFQNLDTYLESLFIAIGIMFKIPLLSIHNHDWIFAWGILSSILILGAFLFLLIKKEIWILSIALLCFVFTCWYEGTVPSRWDYIAIILSYVLIKYFPRNLRLVASPIILIFFFGNFYYATSVSKDVCNFGYCRSQLLCEIKEYKQSINSSKPGAIVLPIRFIMNTADVHLSFSGEIDRLYFYDGSNYFQSNLSLYKRGKITKSQIDKGPGINTILAGHDAGVARSISIKTSPPNEISYIAKKIDHCYQE